MRSVIGSAKVVFVIFNSLTEILSAPVAFSGLNLSIIFVTIS